MRRFFRAQRDEDHSQIQYLTAKCTRLAHDKATQERELQMCRDRERTLQSNMQTLAAQLSHQEQVNRELQENQAQLICRIHRQQDLVVALQQRLGLLAEESSRDAELLLQVRSELLCLQSSEVRLEGLVEELHQEAHCRAEVALSLQAELHEEAQSRLAMTRRVGAMQQENQGRLRKLQRTAEQLERLCGQQRLWIRLIKRFMKRLMGERDFLLQQVLRSRVPSELTAPPQWSRTWITEANPKALF